MSLEGRAPAGEETVVFQIHVWGSPPCSSVPDCAASLGPAPLMIIMG